jgi:hypothetical protein
VDVMFYEDMPRLIWINKEDKLSSCKVGLKKG